MIELWNELFVLPPTKGPAKCAAGASRQSKLLAELQRTESNRVVDGVAENYLSVGYADPHMVRTAEAAEWLSLHDEIVSRTFSRGQFALLPYHDWPVLATAHLCAVAQLREKLRFPRTANEQRVKLGRRDAMVRSWRGGLAPHLFNRYSRVSLVTELVSPLLRVIAPPLRGGTSLNSEERQLVLSLADHHLGLGLGYRQSAYDAEHGVKAAPTLDPPLAELLPCDPEEAANGKPQKPMAPELPAHARSLLASEIHRLHLRQKHASMGGDAEGASDKPKPPAAQGGAAAALAAVASKKAARAPTVRKELVRYDLFGRAIKSSKGARKRSHDEQEEGGAAQHMVRYTFHEGVTDAIRRTVRMRGAVQG